MPPTPTPSRAIHDQVVRVGREAIADRAAGVEHVLGQRSSLEGAGPLRRLSYSRPLDSATRKAYAGARCRDHAPCRRRPHPRARCPGRGDARPMPSVGLFDLSGRVAAVIGGTGVLGGAICHGLADAGAAVAVLGRSIERGQARLAALQAAGASAIAVRGRCARPGRGPDRHRRRSKRVSVPSTSSSTQPG